jgi:uncharacterized SAM-binding protein YcdF (DUF218 family)
MPAARQRNAARRGRSPAAQSRPTPDPGRFLPVNQLVALLGIEAWKPFLGALVLPPVPWIVLSLVGARLILSRRGLGWLLVLLSAAGLWLSSTNGVAHLLARGLLDLPPALSQPRIAELRAQVQAKQPIAVVVLGSGLQPLAPEYGVSNLTAASVERLRYGLWLGRATGAPVAFSGGVGWADVDGGTPEAQIAARIAAQEFGQPLKWTEDRSRDTRQNAALTVALLKAQGIRQVLLVTHDHHQARALRAFRDAAQDAMQIVPAPLGTLSLRASRPIDWLPTELGLRQVRQVLHEAIGRLAGA